MCIIDKCSCAWKPRKIGKKSPVMSCHQKNLSSIVLTSLVILLNINVEHVDSLIIKENPVRLRILEYSSKDGSLLKVLNSRYSDLVVGEEVQENSQIVLECNSLMGPLRWMYSGDGQPQHKSYYSSSSRSGSPVTYTAYLSFPNGLHAKDTGQFTCQNSYNASVSNYVYLFVPKRTVDGALSIFVPNTKKHDLPISNADKIARIPCVVVHPDVKVSLEKVSTSKSFYLEPPMEVPFDPKSGFTVPVTPTAKEIYTCRGEYKGEFEEVTYSTSPIKPSKPRIDPEAELLHEFLDHYLNPHPSQNQTVGPPIAIASYPTQTPKPTTTFTPPTTSQSPRQNTNVPPPEKHLTSACTPQYCGNNAECIVKDYKAYCVCLEEYTGDPKTGCHQISDHSQHLRVEDVCHPSPCGKNAECVQVNGHPLCTCLDGYFGTPPKCSANKFTNCTKNYDCEWTEYCNTETRKCDNICEGPVKFCGKGALCTAFSHMPYCTCPPGASYAGDPYDTEGLGCHVHSDRFQTEGKPSCNPSPCGRNAHCKVYSSYPLPICFCPQGFTGDPSHRCYKLSPAPIIDVFRPHFTPHPPPATSTTTSSQLIISPTPTSFLPPDSLSDEPVLLCTPNFCGENARCRFRNNHPECHCLNGYKGDAYKGCHRTTISPTALRQACSVCGPNSVCSMISSEVRCICAPDTTGVPPNCRKPSSGPFSSSPSSSSSSSPSKLSSSLHNPQVSVVTSSTSALVLQHNRHQSSSSASSSFQFSHQRKSHFACTHDLDCPDDKVCYTAIQKCLNPCSWACSDSGECSVTNHRVHCRCPLGYKGDPYIECVKIPTVSEPESESDQQQVVPQNHPCRFTCGPHTVCRRISAHEMNQLRRRAFSRRDRDPFQRSLVQYIERVHENHSKLSKNPNPRRGHYVHDDHDFTECVCMEGATGNPYSIEGCNFENNNNNNNNHNNTVNNNSNINNNVPAHDPSSDDLEHSYSDSNTNTIVIQTSPCRPTNPCGPHSLCVPFQGQAFCRCDYDAIGEPPNCALRCGKEQHCLFDQVCMRGKCVPEIRRRNKSVRSNH